PEGWVVTTEFAVPKDVAQAVVVLPDGTRRAARAVGRDRSRGLVLLKVDLPAGMTLPVAPLASRADLAVGQWTLAFGRTLSASAPNVAIGILSAVNRAWGKAVQTDASVSPANYGGPLVDVEGRLIGILAPLPADTAGMTAGTELYDSGIGFAVPGDDIVAVLPRLKAGETLRPGILGISYESRDAFTAAAKIAFCSPGSPAAKAGLRAGDTVVAAAGKPVARIAELRHELAPRYAGDTIDLVVERPTKGGGAERVEARATLVAALPAWRRAILGIVADRTASAKKDGPQKQPVRVRWLWPDGPAAKAGVRPGDVIESVAMNGADDASEAEPLPVGSPEVLAGFLDGAGRRTEIDEHAERLRGVAIRKDSDRRLRHFGRLQPLGPRSVGSRQRRHVCRRRAGDRHGGDVDRHDFRGATDDEPHGRSDLDAAEKSGEHFR
ncbi:MAG: trypsin-like peptidase domain-containing protein, partial [Planctomycetia bacterium]